MAQRKILVVDDEALARLDIIERLERLRPDCRVVGQAGNGKAALEMIGRLRPDIVLIDIKMPVMDGIEVIRLAAQTALPCRFIVLSCFEEYSLVREAMHLGADDYLLKHTCTDDELTGAITHACDLLDSAQNNALMHRRLRALMWQQMLNGEVTEDELNTCVKASLFSPDKKDYLLYYIRGEANLNGLCESWYVLPGTSKQEQWVVIEGEGQEIQRLVEKLRCALSPDASGNVFFQCHTDIVDFYRQYQRVVKGASGQMSRKTRQAIDYMHKHYAEQISVESTAEAIGISKTYFSQTFKNETGCSFSEWMQKYRMQKACELLVNTRYKIYEIAEMVGYTDQAYFSVTFKKVLGVSPFQFREGNM